MITAGKPYFITFRDDYKTWAVPSWAPDRIISLAAMKDGAKIVGERPEGSIIWHPSEDL